MARPRKDSKPFNIKMSAELYDRLEKYCEDMGQTVIEGRPDCEAARCFLDLAGRLLADS
mgnify:CR=1 FL=1